MDFLSLCRELRTIYPIPNSPVLIKQSIIDRLGTEPSRSIGFDMAKALTAKWKKDGWVWDIIRAVKPLHDENVLFNDNGISLVSFERGYKFTPLNQFHSRIIWF